MNFSFDLSFLSDVLRKNHVHIGVFCLSDSVDVLFDKSFTSIINVTPNTTIKNLLGKVENNVKYKLINDFKFNYIYLKLPIEEEKNILFIGPYLSSPISSKGLLEVFEKTGVPSDSQRELNTYYSTLPILTDNDKLFSLVDVFCERIFQTSSFSTVELNKTPKLPLLTLESHSKGEEFEEIEENIKEMEQRYFFENELIRAVSLGQTNKENAFSFAFDEKIFEKRVADPIRNSKNYCIIMNTLLRKAAESSGVHPIYIDKTSSKFAIKIELISDVKSIQKLMKEMFLAYCRLVHKHTVKHYSPTVKKVVLLIDSDISAELSLSKIASHLGISAGYLATVFKKETGKTITEYVYDKRIEYASYLLETTQLQIQTIAFNCGVMDVQYFTKIFKRKTGKTPKEYRDNIKHKAD